VTRHREKLWALYYHSSEWMTEIQNGTVRLAIASPPFTNDQTDPKALSKVNYLGFIRRVFAEIFRVLVPNGILVSVNTDLRDHARYNEGNCHFDGLVWQKHSDIRIIAEELGFRCINTKIWAKSLNRNSYRYTFAYIQFFEKPEGRVQQSSRRKMEAGFAADIWLLQRGTTRRDSLGNIFRDAIHPEIARRCLAQFTLPGEIVLSPFTGSGTILAVATLMGRQSIGYEVNRQLKRLISESIETPERFSAYDSLLKRFAKSS